jgi:hypothetical protein
MNCSPIGCILRSANLLGEDPEMHGRRAAATAFARAKSTNGLKHSGVMQRVDTVWLSWACLARCSEAIGLVRNAATIA